MENGTSKAAPADGTRVTLSIKRDAGTDEYLVAYVLDGKRIESRTYYAMDLLDARETRAAMADDARAAGYRVTIR